MFTFYQSGCSWGCVAWPNWRPGLKGDGSEDFGLDHAQATSILPGNLYPPSKLPQIYREDEEDETGEEEFRMSPKEAKEWHQLNMTLSYY